jgi:hypothetical protein
MDPDSEPPAAMAASCALLFRCSASLQGVREEARKLGFRKARWGGMPSCYAWNSPHHGAPLLEIGYSMERYVLLEAGSEVFVRDVEQLVMHAHAPSSRSTLPDLLLHAF